MLLNSRRTLRNHLFVHDECGIHNCSMCGKMFKRRKDLKVAHEPLIHEAIGIYVYMLM